MLRRRMMMGQGGEDYSKMYLTFKALESGTFTFSVNAISYSLDGGSTWTSLPASTATPTIAAGQEICWKTSGLTPTSSAGIGTFSASGLYKAYGNIMSMQDGDSFVGDYTIANDYQFRNLFYNNTNLIDIKGLVMPATSLTTRCYWCMFQQSGITSAPYGLLPATTLSSEAYGYMFAEASSLTNAPNLLASYLPYHSCVGMFRNTKVNYVKCLATSQSSSDGGATYTWLQGASSTGTFVRAQNASWERSTNGIPSGWTIQTA